MYIGIDVGGTNLGVGIVNNDGVIIEQVNSHTDKEKDFDEIVQHLISMVKKVCASSNLEISSIKGIGIGVPGVVDTKNGIFIKAPNLKVSNYPIKEVFERELGIKTAIDNDANCAALAEAAFGATRDFNNSITITLGTGIGGGIIVGKKIFRGIFNSAGEVGHMVITINGEQCQCGRKGCWEQYAATSALRKMGVAEAKINQHSILNKLAGWNSDRITAKLVFEAVKQGDHVAKKVLDRYIKYVSEGIANLINIFGPEAIAIGGSISAQGEKLINPVKEQVHSMILCRELGMPEIRAAKMGREAGIIGSSTLTME